MSNAITFGVLGHGSSFESILEHTVEVNTLNLPFNEDTVLTIRIQVAPPSKGYSMAIGPRVVIRDYDWLTPRRPSTLLIGPLRTHRPPF